mmetsp:Transcript_6869/g.9810  ORF Transcript_6869/g.9810 Transcript_6869/m.9810 type:complete len:367 (+) Transcript_6869:63-1163(+)
MAPGSRRGRSSQGQSWREQSWNGWNGGWQTPWTSHSWGEWDEWEDPSQQGNASSSRWGRNTGAVWVSSSSAPAAPAAPAVAAACSAASSAPAAPAAPAAAPLGSDQATEPAAPGEARISLERHLLLCPNPGRGSFTATYDQDPPSAGFASVNAGNGRSLRVGGSGLNGQFRNDLKECGLPVDAFENLHQELMRAACQQPGVIVEASSGACRRAGCEVSIARVGHRDGAGFVAVDIFEESRRPASPLNIGMVYCVGPDRREFRDDDSFLACLDDIGYGIVDVCAHYSSTAPSTHLQRVRVALVSGGKYAGKVRTDRVAENLLKGIMRGILESRQLQAASDAVRGPLQFELAWADGCFEAALRKLLPS